eukprot:CAMPEP_0194495756 /NCGR_PEP_ID=MMETSP0253-20130528/13248_1 /TAXON_ID=2966 /ORGANISM="Noctiluca scintillans" /LENGTH=214 /DNA_ID=CAMNT_0039337065 /DNA_START=42 /DNA_END=683 /DNA_ORIENTATION=-
MELVHRLSERRELLSTEVVSCEPSTHPSDAETDVMMRSATVVDDVLRQSLTPETSVVSSGTAHAEIAEASLKSLLHSMTDDARQQLSSLVPSGSSAVEVEARITTAILSRLTDYAHTCSGSAEPFTTSSADEEVHFAATMLRRVTDYARRQRSSTGTSTLESVPTQDAEGALTDKMLRNVADDVPVPTVFKAASAPTSRTASDACANVGEAILG